MKIVRKTVCKSNRSGADFSLPLFKKSMRYSWPLTVKEPDSNLHPQSWRQAAGELSSNWPELVLFYKELGLLAYCTIRLPPMAATGGGAINQPLNYVSLTDCSDAYVFLLVCLLMSSS